MQRGSAAQKAGLRPNDLITGIDGQKVNSFEHLTKLLVDYRPAGGAKLTVIRQGQTLEVPVVFDRWGDQVPPGTSLL